MVRFAFLGHIIPFFTCQFSIIDCSLSPPTAILMVVTGVRMQVIAVTAAVALLSLVLGMTCLIMIRRLQKRFIAALGDGGDGNLEATLASHLQRVETVDLKLAELIDEYERLATSTSLASQKISIVRFNPFGDTGGDQSFCLAVLDAHDSGYVLTSIHGREGTRVYVKPVDYRKSKYTLSEEEQQALAQAARRVVTSNKET